MEAASSTIDLETVGDLSLELVWGTWLYSLSAADRHTVFHTELEWHDLFCSGEWSWFDLQEALKAAIEERDS